MTNNTICAFPWVHMSAHLDSDMIICCNTYDTKIARIKKENGDNWKFKDITNPLEFFNTEHYKKIRLDMLKGNEPLPCKKCYDIERLGGTSIRQNSLTEFKAEDLIANTDKDTGEITSLQLQYVHLMWGNKCNLMCKMCDPIASDQLIREFETLKLRKEIDFFKSINLDWDYESNKLVLESIAPHLKILNVTGGEPLINNEFLKYCQYLVDMGYSKNINLAFHTNLTVLPSKIVEVWKHFKSVDCKISVDATGIDYEYIRYPGKWSIFEKNLKELIFISDDVPQLHVSFFTVFTTFNAHGIPKLIDYLCSYDFGNLVNKNPFPNTLWVTHPEYADSKRLPPGFKQHLTLELEQMCKKYNKEEYIPAINMLKANITTMNEENLDTSIFYKFIEKQDALRNITATDVIPWHVGKTI